MVSGWVVFGVDNEVDMGLRCAYGLDARSLQPANLGISGGVRDVQSSSSIKVMTNTDVVSRSSPSHMVWLPGGPSRLRFK